jgi:spermidine/putrescine transport system substrate-binding protein
VAASDLAEGAGAVALATTTPAEIVLYDWVDDAIADVLPQFTEESGIAVRYEIYDSQEEAVENMRSGEVYDVVVLETQFIPSLIEDGLLAEINLQQIPNFKNVSANFRDLAFDPGNQHSIPYTWGTTGLVVRSDLVEEPITQWADMWNPEYTGRVANWMTSPRYTIGATLLMLGYSVNSEEPAELEEALEKLIELKPGTTWLSEEATTAPLLVSGAAVVSLGWSYDYWTAQEKIDTIEYVLPAEGSILWADNFVIPANSPNREAAELFLDFILRPEISAQMINGNYYPMANDAALEFVDEELLDDPVVFPTEAQMRNAELLLPLSREGEQLYERIWRRFEAAYP